MEEWEKRKLRNTIMEFELGREDFKERLRDRNISRSEREVCLAQIRRADRELRRRKRIQREET